MTSLRKSILFMIMYLAFVFNLERLDYNGMEAVNIQSFVYVLFTLAIAATIISRLLQRFSVYFGVSFWVLVYLALKMFIFTDRPVIGDIYTYLTITEISLLTIGIFLAYDLARTLAEFEGVIEKVTFPRHGQRVVEMKSASEDIKTEFIRSRRHDRPLSMLVVHMHPDTEKASLEKTVKNIQRNMLNRYLLASLAQVLSKEARRTDLIIEQEEKQGFVLLCPETTSEGSLSLAMRVQSLAFERLGMTVSCGVASFPEDALTFEDLLQKAEVAVLGPTTDFTPISMPQDEDIKIGQDRSN